MFVHFALVLEPAQPCECEFTHARTGLVQDILHIRRLRVTVRQTPRVDVPCHMELVQLVAHSRWCQPSRLLLDGVPCMQEGWVDEL